MIAQRAVHSGSDGSISPARLKVVVIAIHLVVLVLIGRLFYWQVVKSAQLRAEAASQYQRVITKQGQRGSIYTADGYTLVTNEQRYRLVAYPSQITDQPDQIAKHVTPYIWQAQQALLASPSAQITQDLLEIENRVKTAISDADSKWVSLGTNFTEADVEAIKSLDIKGLGLEPYQQRMYPEASMAAHVLGFVGRNNLGEEVGYFGIEGALDKELRGREERQTLEADALGWWFSGGNSDDLRMIDGRDVVLTIRRDLQRVAETWLDWGIERYGAKSGEILIMEPSTGKILALATWPQYQPDKYRQFEPELYKNPVLTSLYEPGSTLKTLTVSAGIDAGVISPDTICPDCDGPRVIGGYTLRTWNNIYNPDITMTDALAKSDNTAMIYVAEQLGADRLKAYLQAFGLDQDTHVELQEDTHPPFPTKWGPVELATISFGQGISTSTLQVVKAIGAIANQGKLMRPMIVEKVVDPRTQQTLTVEPQVEKQAISPVTAQTVTRMMINAADHGEAQWTASRDHWVAGKTGTSQIAVNGTYDPDKTIASFVGFAPPDNPKFIMMVKLVEPTSSIWAAETAAPLWYRVADQLYLLLNIPPDKTTPTEQTQP